MIHLVISPKENSVMPQEANISLNIVIMFLIKTQQKIILNGTIQ